MSTDPMLKAARLSRADVERLTKRMKPEPEPEPGQGGPKVDGRVKHPELQHLRATPSAYRAAYNAKRKLGL